jgi:CHRD domain
MHTCFQTPRGQAHPKGAKTARLAPLIGLLLLLVSAAPVWAQTFTFTAVITSGQEPPPNTNASEAFGVALVTFNRGSGELCFSISYEESTLTSAETNAHFHAPAPPGENAPVVVQLPTPGSPKNGCVTPDLTEDQRRALFRGLWYVNIHTANNPGGEIRGQVIPQVAPIFHP